MAEYSALIKIAGCDLGANSYSILQSESGCNYVHINNHETNKNSVIVAKSELDEALRIIDLQLTTRDPLPEN